MGLFGRDVRTAARDVRTAVLRADGQRIDLSNRAAMTRLVDLRQPWQSQAWDYRDMIGELRYSQRLLSQSVAQVRFYAAQVREWPDEPAELSGTDHSLGRRLATDAIANLNRLPLGYDPDGFIACLAENLATVGELWIHGEQHGDGDESETWTVRSVSEVQPAGERVMISELPGTSSGHQRPIDPTSEELLRCWVRHPRWGQLADSPLRSMLDVLEEVVLTGREIRAAARSRVASNGILFFPSELSLVKPGRDTGTGDRDPVEVAADSDEFMDDLASAIIAPLHVEGHAQSVVPLVVTGAAEYIDKAWHLKIDRADAEKLIERQHAAVTRMLRGLDVQLEQVEGLGQTSHWNAWQIEAASVRHQIEPMAGKVAGCLTKAFLRPALRALGHPADQVDKVMVWYDVSDLVENPNKGQDARDAHDRLTISDSRFRRDLGYDDDDAPDEEEMQRRVAVRTGVDPTTSALVLDMARTLRDHTGGRARVIDLPQREQLPAGTDTDRPAGDGDVVPERRAPAEPTGQPAAPETPSLAADAGTGWSVDLDLCRALADLDVELRDRIATAADAAVARVVERAGGRARNAVRKDRRLAAAIEGLPAERVCLTIGAEALAEYASLPELVAESYSRLRRQVSGWLSDAAARAAGLVARMLRHDPDSDTARQVERDLTGRLAGHRDAALLRLTERLDTAAQRALFRDDPLGPEPGQRGEPHDLLVRPAEISEVLTVAGGGQPGTTDRGLAVGPTVAGLLAEHGGVVLGYEWDYRPERQRREFPAHRAMHGRRFTTWTDPELDTDESTAWLGAYLRPGDHDGCLCDGIPVVATPEPGAELTVGLAPRTGRSTAEDQVAADDDAAGRVGTIAQQRREARELIAVLRDHYIQQGATP